MPDISRLFMPPLLFRFRFTFSFMSIFFRVSRDILLLSQHHTYVAQIYMPEILLSERLYLLFRPPGAGYAFIASACACACRMRLREAIWFIYGELLFRFLQKQVC